MPGNGISKVTLTVGTAFKPPLGELYKKQQFAPKFAYLRSKIKNSFLGRGTAPSPNSSQWGGDTPPHIPPPSALLEPRSRTRCLTLCLQHPVPHLLILEPHCLVPTLLFLGNDLSPTKTSSQCHWFRLEDYQQYTAYTAYLDGFIERIQLLSPASFFGGPGKLIMISLASCDFSRTTSFSRTAVCICFTLRSSLPRQTHYCTSDTNRITVMLQGSEHM